MPKLTPGQRRLRAQLAANARWAREDPAANVARASAALQRKYEDQVDPHRILAPAERARRAACARREQTLRASLAASRARTARAEERRRSRAAAADEVAS